MSARTDLIADWQRRLAAAEDRALDASNLGWLAAARVRLYRFLLSLYGDGHWNADACDDADAVAANETPTVVIDAEGAFPFHGKPAKGIGKIQAVLKSVANANEAIPAGPLVDGLDSTSWIIAATGDSVRFLNQCVLRLNRHQIGHRIILRGQQVAIEVQAFDIRMAAEIVERVRAEERNSRKERLRHFRAHPDATVIAVSVVLAILAGPFVGALFGYLVSGNPAADWLGPNRDIVGFYLFLTVWGSFTTFAIAFVMLPSTRGWLRKIGLSIPSASPRVVVRRKNCSGRN